MALENGLDNPQVLGIATIFEGRLFNPNLLIRHKGSQRIFISLNHGVVNSAAPGNRLARKSLSVVTVL